MFVFINIVIIENCVYVDLLHREKNNDKRKIFRNSFVLKNKNQRRKLGQCADFKIKLLTPGYYCFKFTISFKI